MAETEEGGEKEEEEEEQKISDGFRMEEVSPPREKKRRKKARERDKERRIEEESEDLDEVRDPLMVFGSDILMMILTNLDARSVARSLLVSRGWCRVASSDRLWSPKCEELWLGKAHIPRIAMVQGISRLEAYSFSIMDGKRVQGAFVQGLGYHLTEKYAYDEKTGKLMTDGTSNYKPPSSKDIPIVFNVSLLPNSSNPFGVLRFKFSGEPPYATACSAFFAVRLAIASAKSEWGDNGWFALKSSATVEDVAVAADVP